MKATVTPIRSERSQATVAEAVATFLERVDLAVGTARKYRHTLSLLVEYHGEQPIAAVGADELTGLLEHLAGQATGQTWNRHRAALGSLWAYAHKRGWVATDVVQAVERRRANTTRRGEQRKRTIPMRTLERLWGNRGIAGRNVVHPLRERTFWRLAYDTAARADELLNLNVEDLDLSDRSAPVVGKGGEVRRVRWTTGTNRLLRELVGQRTQGPVFLTGRRATGDVPVADRDPDTGRARLSYRRAHELFEAATGGQWTLHQLRHTRLSHFADDGVDDLHALKAISGHKSFRSLEGYLHPSDDAVRRVYDHRDPDARRRRPGAGV